MFAVYEASVSHSDAAFSGVIPVTCAIPVMRNFAERISIPVPAFAPKYPSPSSIFAPLL